MSDPYDEIMPACPVCLVSTNMGWTKVDCYDAGGFLWTQRQLDCCGCGWGGLLSYFPWTDTVTEMKRRKAPTLVKTERERMAEAPFMDPPLTRGAD